MGEYRDRVIVNPRTGTVRGMTGTGEVLTLSGVGRPAAPKTEPIPTKALPDNFDFLPDSQKAAILRDLHNQGQAEAIRIGKNTFVHPSIRGKRG